MAFRHALWEAGHTPHSCPILRSSISRLSLSRRHRGWAHKESSSRSFRMAAAERDKPVLVFDVMDTLVWDPFYTEMPDFFSMKLPDLLKQKHPTAWPEFEKGEIEEEELFRKFFKDGRPINGPGLVQQMVAGYRFLDGIEQLLRELKSQGVEMHIMSNYPVWYKRIEAKLGISRFLPWTFVSSEGPMKGVRKPDPQCYKLVSETLGVPPEQIVLIDDRQNNVIGALECGWGAFQYKNTPALAADLIKRRILDTSVSSKSG